MCKHSNGAPDNGIGEPVERKFAFAAIGLEHGTTHSQDCAVLFLAKDRAFPAVLRFYRNECERIGAGMAQLLGVDLLLERVERYQAANPQLVKVPDVDDGPAGAPIIAANVGGV